MTDESVKVTQADRGAAAAHYSYVQSVMKAGHHITLRERTAEEIGRGRWDKDEAVQAFARHRRDTLEQAAKDDARAYLRGVETAWDTARGTNADLCKTPGRAYRVMMDALNKLRHQAIRNLADGGGE